MATKQQTIVVHKKEKNKNKDDGSISIGLKNRIDAANKTAQSAEEKIMVAYQYATKVDGLKPKEAAKVLLARLNYSPQWLRRFLPDEAKHLEKRRISNNVRVTKETVISPNTTNNNQSKIQDYRIIIPAERVRKFYSELAIIEEKALKYGLYIDSKGNPKVVSV